MKNYLIVLFLIVALFYVNFSVLQKEKILDTGTTILLELAPVDPRSLMQGDYMILAYRLARDISQDIKNRNGFLILKTDSNQVASFVDFYREDRKPQSNEIKIRYRLRNQDIRLGAESYFFQEGHAKYYENAKYGELKVSPDGESLLVGLRDADFKRLQAPEEN